MNRETASGVAAMIAAATIWGLSPLYYRLIAHVPPLEVLAHRTLWSALFFVLVLMVQGRIGALAQAMRGRRSLAIIALAALMISLNWYFFIRSVQIGRVVEASLGYYIFPLTSVLFGAIFFRERLARAQGLAVALVVLAVVVLTAGLGVAPWISLVLAVSFGLYGVIKKGLAAGPVVSVTAEVLLLAPVAGLVLVHAGLGGVGHFAGSLADSVLLAFSGLMTGLPLILFSLAARRLRLASVGLIQYLNPTLQFLVATVLLNEPFSVWHMMAFLLIWTALAIYSASAWRREKAARNFPISA